MSRTETLASRAFAPRQTSRIATLFQRLPEQASSEKWPDPHLSTGQFVLKVGKDSIWQAIGPARDAFEALAPNIKDYLERSIEPISCWVTWSIYMMGRAAGTASPTIIFCCEVLKHRRDIRKAVKDSGLLSGYPGFKTGHMSRPPDFDQLVPLAYEDLSANDENTAAVSAVMTKSAPGMQLFLSSPTPLGKSRSKRATVGGVIKVNNEYFYTTASHPLSQESDEDSDAFSFDEDSDASEASSDTNVDPGEQERTGSIALLRTTAATSEVTHGRYSSFSLGRHHDPHQLPSPPISTFSRTIPDPEIKVASLRVRAVSSKGSSLDYALVDVEEPAHMAPNDFETNGEPPKRLICTSVGEFGSSEWPVLAVTARGAIRGTLYMAPSYMLTPGSTSYCETRFARFESPLEEGDSGSWVINELWGYLFGHIVAGSPQRGMAVVVPFSAIFADIEATMGASPELPTEHVEEPCTGEEHDYSLKMHGKGALYLTGAGARDSFEQPVRPEPRDQSETREDERITHRCPHCQRSFTHHHNLEHHLQAHDREQPYVCSACNLRFMRMIDLKRHGQLHAGGSLFVCPKCNRQFNHADKLFEHVKGAKGFTESRHNEHDKKYVDPQAPAGVETFGEDTSVPTSSLDPSKCLLSTGTSDEMTAPHVSSSIYAPDSLLSFSVTETPGVHEEAQELRKLLLSLSSIPERWDDPEVLDQALQMVPLHRIYSEANEEKLKQEARADDTAESHWGFDEFVIMGLMHWFKREFFTWSVNPLCPTCYNSTRIEGNPHDTEMVQHRCMNLNCGVTARFPRYEDLRRSLQTRSGRAGDWANCFGLFCRALGTRVRFVWSAESYVWVEVLSERQNRWIHIDVCEGAWDDPLMYTKGRLASTIPLRLGPLLTNTHLPIRTGKGDELLYSILR